jgi:DNA polymerase epsilon subunit 1
LDDRELIYYIGESRVLSKDVNSYDSTKGVAITAGKRMAEFLGSDTIKGPGLNCTFIISLLPPNVVTNFDTVVTRDRESHPDLDF